MVSDGSPVGTKTKTKKMNLDGLDYNTQRQQLKLMAYGRDIQQMVEQCIALPTKEERQACAATIIETMKRVVSSQLSYKEREPILWYHLALMSDFKLDIDYPVDIEHEDELAKSPETIPYSNKRPMPVRHYGRMILSVCDKLKEMEPGEERDDLVRLVANQMYRCLLSWGVTADREKVVSDLARFTDGKIQADPDIVAPEMDSMARPAEAAQTGKKKKKKK